MSKSAKSKKPLVIGELFSSDSSDDDIRVPSYRTQTSASESESKKKVKLRVNLTDTSDHSTDTNTSNAKSAGRAQSKVSTNAPSGYTTIHKMQIGTIKHNTCIQYEKQDGKMVKTKYFKKCDRIAGTILLGFYSHNRRNYSESLDNIKTIFIQSSSAGGGASLLRDTIEMQPDEWKTLRRDMIVSYEKKDGEYIYRTKFNSFLKGKDGSSRMSFTSEQGFSYIANPDDISKLFRHITSNDRTLTFILEALKKLEHRVRALEQKK